MNNNFYFIVSVDVEEDMPNWKIEPETTVRNLTGVIKLQQLFDKYNIRPTYLLNYPYAADKEAVSFFTGIKNKCEIGAHLHSWNTPPLEPGEASRIEYLSNLPYVRQLEKIKTMKNILHNSFGVYPTSFRSGKFGLNSDTITILEKLGFLVDSSITPMVSWEEHGGPSFTKYRTTPFFWKQAPDLLEVPVTIGLTRSLPLFLENMYQKIPKWSRIRGLLSKDYLNIIDLTWLYPALFSDDEMIHLVNTLKKNINVFTLFFHSSELKKGESLYTKTDEEINRYFDRLNRLFDFFTHITNIKNVTLTEYRNIILENNLIVEEK